jgi:homoserine dehydrogenase
MAQVRLLLIGIGNVGRRFLELLLQKGELLGEQLGIEFVLVGAADSSGVAMHPKGLDLREVVELKTAGKPIAAYPQYGHPGGDVLQMVLATSADMLIEASPANMQTGQPALGCIEAALGRGMDVVTANKAPLVLAFPRLLDLARAKGAQLRYDATVAGGLPAINLGQRDLAAASIHRIEGVVNLTTNYILTRMAQDQLSYTQALREAQEAGHAETDPTLDVEGWDAANKLVILAHSTLDYPVTLDEVEVEGITQVTPNLLERASEAGKRIKLLALAERLGDGYRLSVKPTWLEDDHPLAQLGPKQMGIVYHSDICGVISAAIVEETPIPTASAVLRDVVEIWRA